MMIGNRRAAESCQAHHSGVVLEGRLRVEMDDGSTLDLGANDVFDIPPGHDGWVVSEQPMRAINWSGVRTWLPDPETGVGDFAMSYSFGAHAVEVEVDEETGHVRIVDFVAATDCGNLVNPALAETQVEGGAAQGIGVARPIHPDDPSEPAGTAGRDAGDGILEDGAAYGLDSQRCGGGQKHVRRRFPSQSVARRHHAVHPHLEQLFEPGRDQHRTTVRARRHDRAPQPGVPDCLDVSPRVFVDVDPVAADHLQGSVEEAPMRLLALAIPVGLWLGGARHGRNPSTSVLAGPDCSGSHRCKARRSGVTASLEPTIFPSASV